MSLSSSTSQPSSNPTNKSGANDSEEANALSRLSKPNSTTARHEPNEYQWQLFLADQKKRENVDNANVSLQISIEKREIEVDTSDAPSKTWKVCVCSKSDGQIACAASVLAILVHCWQLCFSYNSGNYWYSLALSGLGNVLILVIPPLSREGGVHRCADKLAKLEGNQGERAVRLLVPPEDLIEDIRADEQGVHFEKGMHVFFVVDDDGEAWDQSSEANLGVSRDNEEPFPSWDARAVFAFEEALAKNNNNDECIQLPSLFSFELVSGLISADERQEEQLEAFSIDANLNEKNSAVRTSWTRTLSQNFKASSGGKHGEGEEDEEFEYLMTKS
ncbi:hypothetical protein LguiA_033801 [Lonicera macranthoides]